MQCSSLNKQNIAISNVLARCNLLRIKHLQMSKRRSKKKWKKKLAIQPKKKKQTQLPNSR